MEDYIVIPCSFIREKNLTNTELYILIEINQLSMLEYGCVASNEHFAKKFGIKKESVSRSINSLVEKGYITSKIMKGSRNFSRKITLNKMLFDPKQNVNMSLTKCLESKGNNNNLNKHLINIDEFLRNEKLNLDSFKEWIEYKKYKNKGSITKVVNFLCKYDKQTQSQIVDTSIMNSWKGLYEPKQIKQNILLDLKENSYDYSKTDF